MQRPRPQRCLDSPCDGSKILYKELHRVLVECLLYVHILIFFLSLLHIQYDTDEFMVLFQKIIRATSVQNRWLEKKIKRKLSLYNQVLHSFNLLSCVPQTLVLRSHFIQITNPPSGTL